MAGLVLFALSQLVFAAHAQAQDDVLGLGASALPGVERVPLPDATVAGPTIVLGGAYGFTESLSGDAGAHHQGESDLAAGLRPLAGLGLGLRLHGQLDHSADGYGFLLRSNLAARYMVGLRNGLHLGGQVAARLPAASGLSAALEGAGVSGALLGGYRSETWSVGALAGASMDRGSKALSNPERLSQADRVSLELSDPPQLVFGLAGAAYAGGLAWIAEWTWDPAFGQDAPAVLNSPMWFRFGVRRSLTSQLALTVLAAASPSQRPAVTLAGPLQRIEPRVWLGLRLAYAWDEPDADRAVAERPPTPEPTSNTLAGVVRTEAGDPVKGARVVASDVTATTDESGRFVLPALPLGEHAVVASAPGYADTSTRASVGSGAGPALELRLVALPMQLFGLVVDPRGVPVAGAEVRLLRGDQSIYGETDGQGRFQFVDQAVGEVTLSLEAHGFAAITRSVVIRPGMKAVRLSLSVDLPDGEIRGTVQEFDGPPLPADIVVSPIGVRAKADAQGRFSLDVPPGNYKVQVHVPGYTPQTRRVRVEERGVTVLIVDLRKRP